jgi:transcriptional regulator with XRE-family HTH domain
MSRPKRTISCNPVVLGARQMYCTVQDIADEIGINRTTIERAEHGQIPLSAQKLDLYCAALKARGLSEQAALQLIEDAYPDFTPQATVAADQRGLSQPSSKFRAPESTDEIWEFGKIIDTREDFWNDNIIDIITESEKLIVFDSYPIEKHVFWETLRKRFYSESPFEFIMCILQGDDSFLQRCLDIMEVAPSKPTDDGIMRLRKIARIARSNFNKKCEAYYWKGNNPGPIMSWTKGGKETIALGFWLNLPAATDGVPYVVVTGGYLFAALKSHYELLLEQAIKNRRIIDLVE